MLSLLSMFAPQEAAALEELLQALHWARERRRNGDMAAWHAICHRHGGTPNLDGLFHGNSHSSGWWLEVFQDSSMRKPCGNRMTWWITRLCHTSHEDFFRDKLWGYKQQWLEIFLQGNQATSSQWYECIHGVANADKDYAEWKYKE